MSPNDPVVPRRRVERAIRRLAVEQAAALGHALVRALDELGLWAALERASALAAQAHAPPPQCEAATPELGTRRVRRTKEALRQACDRVLAVLREQREPMAIGAIAQRLGTTPKALARPLVWLRARGRVTKEGSRRGARYRLVRARSATERQSARAKTRPGRRQANKPPARERHRRTAATRSRKRAR